MMGEIIKATPFGMAARRAKTKLALFPLHVRSRCRTVVQSAISDGLKPLHQWGLVSVDCYKSHLPEPRIGGHATAELHGRVVPNVL
jgi:hypothetical protein